jgi:predicted aspartyl protease
VGLRACLLLVGLAACATRSSPAPVQPVGPSASLAASVPVTPAGLVGTTEVPAGPRHASLKFELNGRKFPLPLVHATVSGEPVWLIVDTGANSHVIAGWVAKKVGLTMRPLGDVGSDHAGRAVTAYTVEHPNVVVDEWGPLADGPMLVTDVPEPIARTGIGGFVSPQTLAAADEGLVLDMPGRQMRSAAWDDAVKEVQAHPGRDIAPNGVRLCEDTSSSIRGLLFVLPASVDGHGVDLLLDTGAHRTDLLTTSKAGHLLTGRAKPSKELVYAASGLVRTSLVRATQVKIGDWSITADIDLVPGVADPVCPRDGAVSMDTLDSCLLLLGHKEMQGRCGP